MSFFSDAAISFHREIVPTLRNWYYVAFGVVQPLLYLALFAPLLDGVPGGSVADGGVPGGVASHGASPLQWFVPGMVAMLVLFNTASAGWTLTEELASGSFERLLATPMRRSSILVGRAAKDLAPLLAQALIVMAVAAPFGFVLHPLSMLLGLALVLTFGVGVAALSYALAIASKRDGTLFYMVSHSVALPTMLLGGVLLPMQMAPRWLYLASRANPLTYVVEAERLLFAGEILRVEVLLGAACAALTAIVGLTVGVKAMRRAAL